MKPNELIGKDCIEWGIHSIGKRNIYPYLEKDCVVAYDKNKLGSIFIIKGKIKSFAFFYVNDKIKHYLFNSINCRRIDLDTAVKMLGDCNILNKEEYEKIKREIILDNL